MFKCNVQMGKGVEGDNISFVPALRNRISALAICTQFLAKHANCLVTHTKVPTTTLLDTCLDPISKMKNCLL